MSNIADMAARRWNQERDPGKYSPRDALMAVVRDIDNGELNPDHIVIVYLRDNEGVGYYQSGKGGWIKAIGMLERAKHLLLGGE